MALNPSTNATMSGRVTAADANYPYGSSKDESSPGAGDGTPYFKARADDIFGLQQSLLDEASIVPSGNADNKGTSQYKEAIRTIMNMRTTTHDMASDANYTLTDAQNRKRRVVITDTGVVLTGGVDIVVDDMQKRFIFKNDTAQILTVIIAGASVAVAAGATVDLYNDGTDIIEATDITSLSIASTAEAQAGTNDTKAISPLKLHEAMFGSDSQQAWIDVTASRTSGVNYTNTTGRPIEIVVNSADNQIRPTVDGVSFPRSSALAASTVVSMTFTVPNGIVYSVLATGTIEQWVELR